LQERYREEVTGRRGRRRPRVAVDVYLYSFLNPGARWGWVVNVTPRQLYPCKRDPVSTLQEAGWAPGPVWTGVKNLASPPGFDPQTVQTVASRYTD